MVQAGAGFIASICYVGDGKAYGYVDIPGYYKPGETETTAISDRAVELDIYNQTLKKIDGLDISNGYGILVSKYKNGVCMANASAKVKGVCMANASAKVKGVFYMNLTTGKINSEPMITTIGNPMAIYWFDRSRSFLSFNGRLYLSTSIPARPKRK